ncbi:MAG: hypothetical protein E4H14_17040 [Candidatus Thorarchaeota archaeon]|nr:MAG: hypothetical protein E4H14_17040 [Candidatus Thorarchaeota archaeon]
MGIYLPSSSKLMARYHEPEKPLTLCLGSIRANVFGEAVNSSLLQCIMMVRTDDEQITMRVHKVRMIPSLYVLSLLAAVLMMRIPVLAGNIW